MGKEPPLVLQFFWGGNFFLKVFWILLLMVQVALFYLYSFGYNIFLKMMGKNFQIRMSPSPLHARAIISNRGPTFLHEHWFPLIFWGNFFLKIFWILLLMVQVASFYLYSFGYNIFLKMMGKNQFFKHSICRRVWRQLTPKYLTNLFVSMHQRMQLCIEANGGSTKYYAMSVWNNVYVYMN